MEVPSKNKVIDTHIHEIRQKNIPYSTHLQSIILVGGKGTRLDPNRKKISQEHYPQLHPSFWDQEGPKGLAMMTASHKSIVTRKPMTDWHLDVHASCAHINKITLSLGTSADMMVDYYASTHKNTYKSRPIHFLIEKNPAGTIAPLAKLSVQNALPSSPVILANGDNLLDIDFYAAYLEGIIAGHALNIPQDELVIDCMALVPHEHSHEYGIIEYDHATKKVNRFREKAPVESNPSIMVEGKKMSLINSGFSIICNPKALLDKYLSQDVITTSAKLEQGELDYKAHESIVRYETFYGQIAALGKMVGIHASVYWTDLGTEEKLLAAEAALPNTFFFSSTQSI